jgi:hypothetical protein
MMHIPYSNVLAPHIDNCKKYFSKSNITKGKSNILIAILIFEAYNYINIFFAGQWCGESIILTQ